MINTHNTALVSIIVLSAAVTLGADKPPLSKPERIANLKAARPLNHHVHVTRTGRVLKLDYQLIGSDGKKHNLWDIRDQNKPRFAIYHDGHRIGGGVLEFG